MGPLHLGSHCECEVEVIWVLGEYADMLTRQSAVEWGKVVVDMLRRDGGAVVYEVVSPQTGVMQDWNLQRSFVETAVAGAGDEDGLN